MPSAPCSIVSLLQISSRSRFANIVAIKLRRLFCTARFRLHRWCPNTRSHFAASEEPQHTVIFQGLEGSNPTTIRHTRDEVGEIMSTIKHNINRKIAILGGLLVTIQPLTVQSDSESDRL